MPTSSITRHQRPNRQRGAVAVFVAVTMVLLVTALGLVLDLGHLYVAKTEMQNAADACALAAVWEISPYSAGNTARARAAGVAVGSKNKVDFQSDDVLIQNTDITFSETLAGPYGSEVTASTRYVRCAPQGPGGRSVALWIMGLWGDRTSNVTASAVAGIQLCGFPLAFCSTDADPSPATHFGFKVGSWYGGRPDPKHGGAVRGNFSWIDMGDLDEVICRTGECALGVSGTQEVVVDTLPGNKANAAAHALNTRFGIYEGSQMTRDKEQCRPDVTGYSYTWYPLEVPPAGSWPPPSGSETPCDPDAQGTTCNAYTNVRAQTFPTQQTAFALFNKADVRPPPTGTPLASKSEYQTYGVRDRRLVIVPVVRCSEMPSGRGSIDVKGWACGLLVVPVKDSDAVLMEYLGPARNSPCVGRLLPGQANVPVLAR